MRTRARGQCKSPPTKAKLEMLWHLPSIKAASRAGGQTASSLPFMIRQHLRPETMVWTASPVSPSRLRPVADARKSAVEAVARAFLSVLEEGEGEEAEEVVEVEGVAIR